MKFLDLVIPGVLYLAFSGSADGAYRTVTTDGSSGYSSIQSAINASTSSDTIYVRSGQFHEYLTINQSITIIGFQSIEDASKTHVSGSHIINGAGISFCNIMFTGLNTIFDVNGEMMLNACNMTTNRECIRIFTFHNDAGVACESCYFGINGSASYDYGFASSLMDFNDSSTYNLIISGSKIIGYSPIYSYITNSRCQLVIENTILSNITLQTLQSPVAMTTINNSIVSGSGFDMNEFTVYRYCAKIGAWSTTPPTCIVVNTSAFDGQLHPTPGSPLLDAGDPNSPLDMDGTRNDIGCYGGRTPFNDLGYANWYPHLDLLLVQPGIQEQGGELHIEAAGAIGPTWLGSSPVLDLSQPWPAAQEEPPATR